MRSIILLLLFVSGFAYADPIANQPPPYMLCDDNADGFTSFDLASMIPTIIAGQSNVMVTYHETLSDAQSGINAIPSITNYINITPFFQTIYVRVTDTNDSSFATTTLELHVLPAPVVIQPNDIMIEENPFDGMAIFDITSNETVILAGQPDVFVTYFITLADAQMNAGQIGNPTAFANVANPQTIYARVENATTGCYSITSFQLIVVENANLVNIPDANFRFKLTTLGVDTNSDSYIQISEAEAFTGDLDVSSANISDLTGFEAFVNVPKLKCRNNNLSSLTINNMPNLKVIDCGFNINLSSLNLTNLTSIDSLSSYNTNLTNLDLSSLSTLKKLDCSFNHISSLNLSNMTNLKILYVNANWLTSLNVAPLTNLEDLNIGSNQISSINVLPLVNLKRFICNNAYLATLNVSNLPLLEYLDMSNNQNNSFTFANLPSLVHLEAQGNNLVTLNVSTLPALQYLDCSGNDLTSINVSGLVNLTYLTLALNQVASIDISGLTGLEYFNASSNALTTMTINGHPALSSIWLTNNDLTSLNITNTPNASLVYCDYNQLTSLDLSNFSNLNLLYCNNNQLTNLTLTGDTNLEWLDCHENQLTAIDFTGLSSLATVLCDHNQLTALDFSTNTVFNNLSCTFNNLTSINIKNGFGYINTNNFWHENPNLTFVCADEDEFDDVQQILTQSSLSNVVLNTYCSFTPGGNYNTITGTVTFDYDNNGCDASDVVNPNIRVNITDGINPGATFTDAAGHYTFYVQTGNYTVTPVVENPILFGFSPASANISFADNNNNTTTQNFCVIQNGTHQDLEVVIEPITPARPGFDATYRIVYKNKGNTLESGTVVLNFDDSKMDYLFASDIPAAISTGTLTWNYNGMEPFETHSFVVTFNINSPVEIPAVNINDILSFTAVINPTAGDDTPNDNTFVYNQIVVGAYDPNDITCIEGSNVNPSEIGEYLHYVVNFENTGNYAAENVVVKDVIDSSKYDVSSLQLLNSSNPVYARINGNTVEFIFQNINLAAAAGSPPVGGHGDVLFKIKSNNSLVEGDFVSKSASIFFDYNAPIVTNDAQTTFNALSTNIPHWDQSVRVYPNPANDIVTIECNSVINAVELYDIQGRILETHLSDSKTKTLDISNRQSGVYFIKIKTDDGSKVEKLIRK